MTSDTFSLIRLYTGMSQSKFANHVGISRTTVGMIETNQRPVTPYVRAKLAAKFELDDAFFAFLEKFRKISQ